MSTMIEGGTIGLRNLAAALLRVGSEDPRLLAGMAEAADARIGRIESFEVTAAGVRLELSCFHDGKAEAASTLLLTHELPIGDGQRLALGISAVPFSDEAVYEAAIFRGKEGLYVLIGRPLAARPRLRPRESALDVGRWPIMRALEHAYRAARQAVDEEDDERLAS